eukprot:IDg6572t1
MTSAGVLCCDGSEWDELIKANATECKTASLPVKSCRLIGKDSPPECFTSNFHCPKPPERAASPTGRASTERAGEHRQGGRAPTGRVGTYKESEQRRAGELAED